MSFRSLNTEIDFIGIIDMLPPQERQAWNITSELVQFLRKMNVEQKFKECSTNAEVFATLQKFRELSRTHTLLLHFVSHGNTNGIAIKGSNEALITWNELRDYLLKLNRELGGTLIINLTSCFGFEGVRMVNAGDTDLPFYGIIGCEQTLDVGDAKKVNQLFYMGMADGKEIPKIVMEIIDQYGRRVIYGRAAQTQQQMISPGNSLGV